MNFLNFFIIKLLIKVRYANIFNIISNSEIIPELLQSRCNPKTIYEVVDTYIKNPELKARYNLVSSMAQDNQSKFKNFQDLYTQFEDTNLIEKNRVIKVDSTDHGSMQINDKVWRCRFNNFL